MKNQYLAVIIFSILLQGKNSFAVGDQEKHLTKELSIEDQCNGHCFSVVKPFLDHLTELKVAADANMEMKDKISSLQSQLLSSWMQLKNKEHQFNFKDEEVKEKDKQIKENEKHITDLREQVKMMSGVLAEKNDQLTKINQMAENLPDTCPNGTPNGIFQIKVKGIDPFQVPCVPSGWAVIQRRIDGGVDFNRNWTDYKDGFGDIRGEFFLGMEKIHLMTQNQPHEMYIQLRDINGTTRHARYDNFNVGSESEDYELKSLGEYSGTAGDSLTKHLSMKFSTLDRDNDLSEKRNCADNGGGWWFLNCFLSSLNGYYYADGKRIATQPYGIHWGSWKDYDYTISLTFAQMMIRPKVI